MTSFAEIEKHCKLNQNDNKHFLFISFHLKLTPLSPTRDTDSHNHFIFYYFPQENVSVPKHNLISLFNPSRKKITHISPEAWYFSSKEH